jgi:hypothetical protein
MVGSVLCAGALSLQKKTFAVLKQFRIITENSGKELNVKESSLKSSEEVFP